MDQLKIKYRLTGKALPPRPIRMKIPGWSGEAVIRKNGSEPQPWHCPPFADAAMYGLELVYHYDTECRVVNENGEIRFEWEFAKEPGIRLDGGDFGLFFPKPSRFYFFATSMDIEAPAGHAIRTGPHPRFYTDATDTVPAAVCGHVQTQWWSKTLFMVFKVPAPGQRHIFRKGDPYAQIHAVPHRLAYEAVAMTAEEIAPRQELERQITLSASHIARNVWHNPSGQEFKDHYRVMSRAFARDGIAGVRALAAQGMQRFKETQPADQGIAQCLALARRRKEEGRVIEARDILFHVMSRDPSNAEASSELGRLVLGMGLRDLARQLMTQAVMLQPRSAAYRTDLGHLLMSMEKFEEAQAVFRTVLQIDPNDAEGAAKVNECAARGGKGQAGG